MENQLVTSVVTVATAIIGVAIIAVLVSKQANTTSVISSLSSGFEGALGTAISPITGNSFTGGGGGYLTPN
jgi:hypothetical protein